MKTTYLIDELKVTVAVLVVEQLLLGIDRVRANRGQHEKHRKGKPQLMHLASDCCDAVPIPPLALFAAKNRRPLYTNEPNKSHAHTHTHKSAPIYSLCLCGLMRLHQKLNPCVVYANTPVWQVE